MDTTPRHTMIRTEDVLDILTDARIRLENASRMGVSVVGEMKVLDEIARKVRRLESKRRLVVIDGGKR